MKFISIQEAFGRKFGRQKKIKELKYGALGSCVYIGTISPGCVPCFDSVLHSVRRNLPAGPLCNRNCVYCSSDKTRTMDKMRGGEKKDLLTLRDKLLPSKSTDCIPAVFSFSGGGEPLLYLDFISTTVTFIHRIFKDFKRKPYLYLYTNGVLANRETLLKLRDLGFDEIRFHLGASNFARSVYEKMRIAVKYFKSITMETPAWPLHRKQLFRALPILEDIGVRHVNLGEMELNYFNYERILRAIPNPEIYPCYEVHLYDGGLVYDIMEEVIRKKYSYSVLDCNCFVKLMQRGKASWSCCGDSKGITMADVQDRKQGNRDP